MPNNHDALIPELWAMEGLEILEESMVIGGLINRDYSKEVKSSGDVVNVHRPNEYQVKRKVDDDEVTIQDSSVTNIQVPLNQHLHTSFLIKDGEETKSFKDLVNLHLSPAMLSIAQGIDKIVGGQGYRFRGNAASGTLTGNGSGNGLDGTNGKGSIVKLRKALNDVKVPQNGRNVVLTTDSEANLLQEELFVSAEKRGDQGTALHDASLGHIYGMDFWMAQNTPEIVAATEVHTDTVNGAHTKGDTTVAVTEVAGVLVAGQYIVIEGVPYRVASYNATTDVATLETGLVADVADAAVIYKYTQDGVDGAQAANYAKYITVDDGTNFQVGQLVSFGTAADEYAVIEVLGNTILLDRPLAAAIADNEVINIGPNGSFNFAFTKNAVALVSRPLAKPREKAGALSAVRDNRGIGLRVVITYDGKAQGHLVTLDLLCGVAVLDENLGGVMYG